MSDKKEMAELVRRLRVQGFEVRLTRGHWQVRTAAGRFVTTMPSSPSDWRGFLNARRYLRAAGFDDQSQHHTRKTNQRRAA